MFVFPLEAYLNHFFPDFGSSPIELRAALYTTAPYLPPLLVCGTKATLAAVAAG